MSLRPRSAKSSSPTNRPAVDEWGIYDPSQAGLAALYERLDARRLAEPEAKTLFASVEEANVRLKAALKADAPRR